MKNLLSLFLLLSPLLVYTQNKRVADILESHFEALNQEDLSKIKSLSIKGLFVQNGIQIPLTIHKERPYKWRQRIALNQQEMLAVLNEGEGWEINQFMGIHQPRNYNQEEIRERMKSATIDNQLWYLINTGTKVEFIQEQTLDGNNTYQLRATDEFGNTTNIYIDAITKLLYKTEEVSTQKSFIYEAYQTVDGIVFPKRVSVQQPQGSYAIEFTTITLDVKLEEALFAKPHVQTTEQIAEEYLRAFYDLDYEKLKSFYTASSCWHDPSTAVILQNAPESIGRDKIIADLRSGFNGVFDASYEIEKAFYSGPYAILWGTYSYKIPAKYFQGLQSSSAIFNFSIPMATNLLIRDGKVLKHLEHGDWASWSEQVQKQVQQLKSEEK